MEFDYKLACMVLFIVLAGFCFIAAIVALCETAFALSFVLGLFSALLAAGYAGCSGGVEG